VEAIRTKFGHPVASYIQEINPGRWTVHTSMSSYLPVPPVNDSISTLPLPMFGWRSTNFVESDNSATLQNGIRDTTPFEVFMKYALVAMERASQRDIQAK
jgi:hypothetical protein